jgi:hypothetical protein
MFIALLMEAASTSETSVNIHQTAMRNNPQKPPCLKTYREFSLKHHLGLTVHIIMEFSRLLVAQLLLDEFCFKNVRLYAYYVQKTTYHFSLLT